MKKLLKKDYVRISNEALGMLDDIQAVLWKRIFGSQTSDQTVRKIGQILDAANAKGFPTI